uniref:Zinc finger, CCHC-type n=1 Tax=Tanacetum cinerariifolium TaxID=118510 RepID=A0A6L2M4N0_TANCI|nr:zinc finger, CCHC-type [Tanacetum cinerariifolium]
MAAAAMKHMASSFAKLEKFEGVDFRRWQKKMHFMLFSMSVVYVLTTPMPEDGCENTTVNKLGRGLSGTMTIMSAEVYSLMEELTLIELGSHLYIEESLRVQDSDKPKGNNVAGPSVVNMVEHNNSSRANGSSTKVLEDGSSNPLKGYSMFNKSYQIYYVTYVSEAFFLQDDDVAWWVDSGATVHVCKDRCWFKTYESLNDESILHIENKSTALVHGRSCVDLRFYVIKPNDSVAINSIIESRDAIFDEQRFSSVSRPSQRSLVKGTEDSGGTRDEVFDQHSYCFNVKDDPKTFDKAMKYEDVAFWKEAINDVMDSIMKNNTWVLTDLPPGIYFDTYTPVERISTIRLLIAMASFHNLIIHHIDVKTTFLNGELEEEVYMNLRLGFIMPGNDNKVCKLIKSLYGLKQAPKQWHQKFDEVVLSNGYLLNQADKCVYKKFEACGKGVVICLYVDDMLIFGTDQVQVDLTKEFLSSRFSMKDMGEAVVILGIRIKHKSNDIAIFQSHYIEKVLKKFNYSDYTPVSTLLDTCEKLMPNRGPAVSQHKYFKVIGCLMYAMTCTRPDIAFAVENLSRLVYIGYPSVLEGYTDASWIGNTKDNSSASGWLFLLSGGAISWASKKQTCITSSTIKSEFVALAAAGKEAEWLKNLLFEIPLHLGVRHNMIRELITNGVVSIEFLRSQQNLADHLIKGLARDLVIKYVEGMRAEAHVLQIIPRMCFKPASKEDKVANFSMVNFFEKVLSRSMNKEEPPITWMKFGGNTRDLGSFEEETDEITNLHQILEEVLLTKRGDGIASIKRRSHDLFSDNVWNLEIRNRIIKKRQKQGKKGQNQTQNGKDQKRQSHTKPKVKSQNPRSTKVNPEKVKVNPGNVKVNPDKAEAEK